MKKILLITITCFLLILPVNAHYEGKMKDVQQTINEYYYGKLDNEKIETELYHGLLNALDEHSVYFSPSELKSFQQSLGSDYVGIGIRIDRKDQVFKVITVFDKTPAQLAGLKVGDTIVAVNGKDISDLKQKDFINMIRGKVGTTVTLTVRRNTSLKPIDFTIKRQKIAYPSVVHTKVNGYDVIKIVSFSDDSAKKLKQALNSIVIEKGLIIDLRDNPGGMLGSVVKAADLFLEPNQVITSIDYKGKSKVVHKAKNPANKVKMAVLINQNSASASELFAGAMQDHKRAVIIGKKSYGKGSVQQVFELKDGSALKITVAKYQTPSGKYIHGVGIEPDIETAVAKNYDPAISKYYMMNSLNTEKVGSKSVDIAGLQQRLKYLGYNIPKVTGRFDQNTVNELKKFEQKYALEVDGVLDIKTKNHVQKVFLENAIDKSDIDIKKAIEYLSTH